MYANYWKLNGFPFENLKDLRFAYLSDQHQEGVARLFYLAQGYKLGGVLVGPYGVGKTMILELLAQRVRKSLASAFCRFDAPPGDVTSFVRRMLHALGDPHPVADVSAMFQRLDDQVGGGHANPWWPAEHVVLAIDEAQLIQDPAICNVLHLMTNLRYATGSHAGHPLLTLFMSGHDSFLKVLERHPSLRQRMELVWKLYPLNNLQTREYIQHRMAIAGSQTEVFDKDAADLIYSATQGLPRLINNVCDVALMMGYSAGVNGIGPEIVKQAVRDGLDSMTSVSGVI